MTSRPLLAAALALALASPAFACDDHAPGTEPLARKSAQRPSLVAGDVREVDVEERTVTLRHGRIASLRMAPMGSMRFRVEDAALLAGLNVDDKVRFRATMVGDQPTIVEIRRTPK